MYTVLSFPLLRLYFSRIGFSARKYAVYPVIVQLFHKHLRYVYRCHRRLATLQTDGAPHFVTTGLHPFTGPVALRWTFIWFVPISMCFSNYANWFCYTFSHSHFTQKENLSPYGREKAGNRTPLPWPPTRCTYSISPLHPNQILSLWISFTLFTRAYGSASSIAK